MALPAGFWTGGGDSSRWIDDFTGYAWGVMTAVGGGHVQIFVSRIRCYQMPFSTGGTGGMQQAEASFDTGYYYLADSGYTTFLYGMACDSAGVGGSSSARPQWKQLRGVGGAYHTQGDGISPTNFSTAAYNGIYKTGFIWDAGATRFTIIGNECDTTSWHKLVVGTWYVWHYAPWAWFGAVPEVIADVLLKVGLDSSYIDTAAFDNAYDAFHLTTGDIPFTTASDSSPAHGTWGGAARKLEVGCVRRVGQKVIDLLLELCRHSRDFYYVNEAGKVSVSSFTRPNNTVTSLSITDGIIDSVEWRDTSKWIINDTSASWGWGTRCSGDITNPPNGGDFSAAEEPNLESYKGDILRYTTQIASSITKYGTRSFKGKKAIVITGGQPREVEVAHFPYILQSTDPASGGVGQLVIVWYWATSDAKPRRLINIKQDMRALDWGIGDQVEDVAVTDDGETIAVTRCIERTYDFKTLTVESTLMEIPDNTTAA